MIFIHHPSLHISKWEVLRITAVLQLLEAVVHCVVNLDPKSMCVCVRVFVSASVCLCLRLCVCVCVCVHMCLLTWNCSPTKVLS